MVQDNVSNFTRLFSFGVEKYGNWPSEIWGLSSVPPHISGVHLSFSPAIPALVSLIPLSAISLQCGSLSQRSAQEGQCQD